MIDYDKPDDDPIVEEVRRARAEIGAPFNYDLAAIIKEFQRRQSTTGRTYVSLPPRKLDVTSKHPRKAG